MEEWKDKVMDSLTGLERAKPPVDGFQGIQRKLAHRSKNGDGNRRQWMAVAAVILMVISSNVILVTNYLKSDQQSSITSEYPEMITSYNLYENE